MNFPYLLTGSILKAKYPNIMEIITQLANKCSVDILISESSEYLSYKIKNVNSGDFERELEKVVKS